MDKKPDGAPRRPNRRPDAVEGSPTTARWENEGGALIGHAAGDRPATPALLHVRSAALTDGVD